MMPPACMDFFLLSFRGAVEDGLVMKDSADGEGRGGTPSHEGLSLKL